MPTYAYRAKKGPARTVDGELDAESEAAAIASLDAMGYIPVWVREKSEQTVRARRRFGRSVSHRDVTVFTRQLASMTKSGVPILRALATISEQTENARLCRVVRDLEQTIRDGNMLSAAMSKHGALFPDLYVNMVRSGESGGVLDAILFRLAEAREKEEDLRRKVQSALAYPILVLAVGIVTVFVLLAFFMPRVIELFEGYRRLPLPTRILIGVSEYLSQSWYWIALAAVLALAVVRRLASIEKGRALFDHLKLRLPVLGRLLRESDIARFARTLSLLIDAGIPIDRALHLGASTLRNSVLRDEVERVREQTVQQGVPVSAGLKRTRTFPLLVSNMAAVGEEAGRLDEALAEVASFYEKNVEQQTRLATSLLEPILILAVGLIVGLIVAAMLLPIFEIGTAL